MEFDYCMQHLGAASRPLPSQVHFQGLQEMIPNAGPAKKSGFTYINAWHHFAFGNQCSFVKHH